MSKDEVIQLWLDAEEENRKGNDAKCNELKGRFCEEFGDLSKDEQEHVKEYLDDVAG
jgi:hypothetical protein